MSKFKQVIAGSFLLIALACQQAQQIEAAPTGDISNEAFAKAMEAYLQTESGMEKIGDSMQAYFQKQQQKAQADRAKQEEQALEDQFKNPIKVDVANAPVKGPKEAKITVVEYSDFECPFCSRGASTVEEIMKAYPKDVKVAFKNLPLPFHKNAKPAALAALAAGKQGKFWEMHDILFANQKGLGEELFLSTAKQLGLNIDQFKKDLADPALAKQIEEDSKEAGKIGISGTPGFVVNGVLVKGAYPLSHFQTIIDRQLKE